MCVSLPEEETVGAPVKEKRMRTVVNHGGGQTGFRTLASNVILQT